MATKAVRNGGRSYSLVGKESVSESPTYSMYVCAEEGVPRECLLQVSKNAAGDSRLDKFAFVLGELKERAGELEKEYEAVRTKPNMMLNYDLGFPELVDSFVCKELGSRRVNVLAFRNVPEVGKMAALRSIVEKDGLRVDLKTSAWILGKLLKLLTFAHSQNISVGMVTAGNVLIQAKEHYVLIFDWSKATLHSGKIPMEMRQQDIMQAAKAVVMALGGSNAGIPDDPTPNKGYGRYADHVLRLARGSESNAQRAHELFYELIQELWESGYHPFTPIQLSKEEGE